MKLIRIQSVIWVGVLVLTACTNPINASPGQIQTQVQLALVETQAAFTPTPTFTWTPNPTVTPIPPTATRTPVPTIGLGSTQISETDGMRLIYVPEGTFIMGGTVDQAMAICQTYRNDCQRGWFTDEEPAHPVTLDAYWIDQTEVTNKMYALCVAAGACSPPESTGSNTRQAYYGNPDFDNFPVIYVSWEAASSYCAWAGRRLPTEAEWEKAASWDETKQMKYTYPWGEAPNDCSLSNYPDTDQLCVGDTTAVGSYPKGKSPYGALDMLGNVWELVSDWYGARYFWSLPGDVRNPTGPTSGPSHVTRGGDFEANSYIHTADRDFEDEPSYFLGFRCARSP